MAYRMAPLPMTLNDKKLSMKICVGIRHGGLRPRQCAGGVMRGVINNTDGSQFWFITVTVQLTSTRLVIRVC